MGKRNIIETIEEFDERGRVVSRTHRSTEEDIPAWNPYQFAPFYPCWGGLGSGPAAAGSTERGGEG